MSRTKFSTKNAFGAKKRGSKPRGRSGGRKRKEIQHEDPASVSLMSDDQMETPSLHFNDENDFNSVVGNNQRDKTASGRKLSLFSSLYYSIDKEVTKNTGLSKSNKRYHEAAPGFRLVKIDCINQLIKKLACTECLQSKLVMEERRQGLMSIFSITCLVCTKKFTATSCNEVSSQHSNEANLLAVAAARNNGIGFQKMCNFMCNMNLPKPMHLKTYQGIAKNIHQAAMKAVEINTNEVAELVRKEYEDNCLANSDEKTNIAISFDGTWHKRGHTSLFGVGIAIDLVTGFALDFDCKSKYCHACEIGPKPSDNNYNEWKNSHKESCQKNFDGSSNAMEAAAAATIFGRSISKFNLRYTTMLCDGDSKAFLTVRDCNFYGNEFTVSKEDCVNHVAKRMGAAIRKLKQDEKLGGRGKLTDVVIEKIQNYYGKAIKDQAPDINKMKDAIYASLFHMVSTDDHPHHRFCPPGKESWCHYQRSLVDINQKRAHKPTISKEIGEKLLPIYKRMTDTDLLKRCLRNKTQNANESFNSLIWRRCPKTEFISLRTLETAVAMAILEFNKGADGFIDILHHLDIEPGQNQITHASISNKRRLDDAQRTSTGERKKLRKTKKIQKTKIKEQLEKKEGIMYKSGEF